MERQMPRIQVGYADFIRLCNVDDPEDWASGFRVAHDGVWVVPPPDDADLLPTERAVLSDHPIGDLLKPALCFPCLMEDLQEFISWGGLVGCVVQEELEKFLKEQADVNEPLEEFVLRLKGIGRPELDIARALIEKYGDITCYRLGCLLPANQGTHISSSSIKKRGQRLKDALKRRKD